MTVPLMPERDIGRTSHFNRTDLRPAHYRPDALAYGRVDTAAALLRAISTLNNLSPRPDLVVIPETSPILRAGRVRACNKAVCALQVPFVAIPGKHDRRPYPPSVSRSRL